MVNGIEFMRDQKRQPGAENKIFYQKSPSCSDKIRYAININAAVFANIAFDNDTLDSSVRRHFKIIDCSTMPGILPFARYDLEIKRTTPSLYEAQTATDRAIHSANTLKNHFDDVVLP